MAVSTFCQWLLFVVGPCIYATSINNNERSSNDPLVRWLDHLKIDIPDQSYKSGLIHLRILGLTCTNFTIARLHSNTTTTATTTDNNGNTISLQTFGVGASCRGNYDASGMTGHLSVHLGSKTIHTAETGNNDHDQPADFLWTFSLLNDENDHDNTDMFPDAIQTVDCKTHVAVTYLHFDGSWSAKLIDLFRESIENEINTEISSNTICPQWSATVDPIVTRFIRILVDYIKPYYYPNAGTNSTGTTVSAALQQHSTTTTTSRTRRQKEVSWLLPNFANHDDEDSSAIIFSRDVPIFTNFLTTANAFVQEHLHRGLLLFDNDCSDRFDQGGVNGILRRNVPNISFTLPITLDYLYGNATIHVHLDHWTIAGIGLHQWQALQVLLPTEPREDDTTSPFVSRLQTSDLDLSVHATITVLTSPTAEPLLEAFSIALNLAEMDMTSDVLLLLDRLMFQNVTAGDVLGSILGSFSPSSSSAVAMACLVAPVTDLHIDQFAPHLNISSLTIQSTTASDDQLEQDLDAVINDILSGLVLKQYGSLISKTILGFMLGPGQEAINVFLKDQINHIKQQSSNSNCSRSQTPHSWIDFTTIGPLQQFNTFLQNPTTLADVNSYVDCAASALGAIIQENLEEDLSPSLIVVDELLFDHFGSFEQVNALRPANMTTLQTSFSIGGTQFYPQVKVNASIPFLDGEVLVSMALSNLTWTSSAMILYDQSILIDSSMQELLSQGQCILAPMYSYNVIDFEGSFGRLELNSTVRIKVHNQPYEIQFRSTDFPEIQDYVWTIFDWTIATMGNAVSAVSAATVNYAQHSCIPSSKGSNDTYSNNTNGEGNSKKLTAHALWVILGTLFILAQPLILLFRHENRANGTEESQARLLSEPLLRQPGSRSQDEVPVRTATPSLMHRFESHTVHYALPVMILFTILLFLCSNSSTGATVDLVLSIGSSQQMSLPGVYRFGLLDTAKNMLSAGIYPLFLLVVVFSGIWPYAKLLLMFSAWVAPSSMLSLKRRERLLTTLDACSKYSLVDTYVFIVMLVAFRYHLQLNTAVSAFSFDVFVAPLFGFYGFLFATTLSLILGHVMIYYHRQDALRDILNSWSSDESMNVLIHRYKLKDGRRCHISKAFVGILGVSFVAIVTLLSLGMAKKSFSFDFGGVAGFLLGEKKNRIDYSVLSLWQSIPESVDGGGIAPTLLQAAFFFYTIATPLICLLLLALLAVCPLTLPGQVKLLSVAEIANSWSALEVFVLSILAALFEISTFSDFIVGDRCYLINEITSKYTELDDPRCFHVTCIVSWDALYLITGTILLSFWSMAILRLARTCIVERITTESSIENDEDEWSLLADLAGLFSWLVVDEDRPLCDDSAILPIIADELIRSQVENPSDSVVWEEATREDPSWKEWKDATNVT